MVVLEHVYSCLFITGVSVGELLSQQPKLKLKFAISMVSCSSCGMAACIYLLRGKSVLKCVPISLCNICPGSIDKQDVWLFARTTYHLAV